MPPTKRPPEQPPPFGLPAEQLGKRVRYELSVVPGIPPAGDQGEWRRETHRAFVEAVMKHGMNRATPSTIQKEMTLDNDALTSERIKSKLQKYRKKGEDSMNEFMREYDGTAKAASKSMHSNESSPGGQVASLTQAILREEEEARRGACSPWTALDPNQGGTPYDAVSARTASQTGALLPKPTLDSNTGLMRIHIPRLTPEEQESCIGRAFTHVLGILEALLEQRLLNLQSEHSANPSVQEVSEEESPLLEPLPAFPFVPGRPHPQGLSLTSDEKVQLSKTAPSLGPLSLTNIVTSFPLGMTPESSGTIRIGVSQPPAVRQVHPWEETSSRAETEPAIVMDASEVLQMREWIQ